MQNMDIDGCQWVLMAIDGEYEGMLVDIDGC